MVRLVSRTRHEAGVTLVEAALVNDAPLPRRVRVESRLDGPAWPPRRQGVPAAGWTGGAYEVTLSPGERHGFGFASPAPPADPPVAIAGEGPVDADDGPDAADVVRTLGDPGPPRDALALPPVTGDGPTGEQPRRSGSTTGSSPDRVAVPPAVADWLAAVEGRIDRGPGDREEGGEVGSPVDLATVARRLRAVAGRASALAARAEGTASLDGGEGR